MLTVFLAATVAAAPQVGPGLPFHDALSVAKQAVYEGDYASALAELEDLERRLDAGEKPGPALATEAQLFLGDVHFVLGDQNAAKNAFRGVLMRNPDLVMSPYDHAEDVRALFALVREEVARQLAGERPPVPNTDMPPVKHGWMTPIHYAPFGVPQWRQRRHPAGRLYGILQGGFAFASIASFVLVDQANKPEGAASLSPTSVDVLRYGVQWPATIGFYTAWGVSVIDASRHWKANGRVRVGVHPNGVQIRGGLGRRGRAQADPPK